MNSLVTVVATAVAAPPAYSMTDSVIKATIYILAMVLLLAATLTLNKRTSKKLQEKRQQLARGIKVAARHQDAHQTLTIYKVGHTYLAVCTTPSGGVVVNEIEPCAALEEQAAMQAIEEPETKAIGFKAVLDHISKSRKG